MREGQGFGWGTRVGAFSRASSSSSLPPLPSRGAPPSAPSPAPPCFVDPELSTRPQADGITSSIRANRPHFPFSTHTHTHILAHPDLPSVWSPNPKNSQHRRSMLTCASVPGFLDIPIPPPQPLLSTVPGYATRPYFSVPLLRPNLLPLIARGSFAAVLEGGA